MVGIKMVNNYPYNMNIYKVSFEHGSRFIEAETEQDAHDLATELEPEATITAVEFLEVIHEP